MIKNVIGVLGIFLIHSYTHADLPNLKKQTPLISCNKPLEKLLIEIPKVHLHVHLEGNVRYSTILDLARENGIDLGPHAFRQAVIRKPEGNNRVEGLSRFLDRFSVVQKVLSSYDAIKRVTLENIEDAHAQGVKILELRFAPAFMSIAHPKLSHNQIFRAVVDGAVEGSRKYPDMKVGLISILVRLHASAGDARIFSDLNKKASIDLFNFVSEKSPGSEKIVGFDLAGAEEGTTLSEYDLYVDLARQSGLRLTVHSGEDSSAAYIYETILRWYPERIGHGIQAAGDKDLQALIKERGIHLELAPTSNWLSRAVPNLESHPIREFYDNGISISLNTDDGHLQNIDLIHEYVLSYARYGFGLEELRKINEDAAKASFIPQ